MVEDRTPRSDGGSRSGRSRSRTPSQHRWVGRSRSQADGYASCGTGRGSTFRSGGYVKGSSPRHASQGSAEAKSYLSLGVSTSKKRKSPQNSQPPAGGSFCSLTIKQCGLKSYDRRSWAGKRPRDEAPTEADTVRDATLYCSSLQALKRRIEFHSATRPETAFTSNHSASTASSFEASPKRNGDRVTGDAPGGRSSGHARHGVGDTESKGLDLESPSSHEEAAEDRLTRLADEEIGLPAAEKGLFPESGVKRWLRWGKVYRIGPGLRNMGNTCFLNATLQCLSYLPPLAQHLLHEKYLQKVVVSNSGALRGGRELRNLDIMGMMRDLMDQVHEGRLSGLDAISPRAIVRNLRAIGQGFRLGRQEDAHEFLRNLLDSMVSGCLRMRGIKTSAPGRLAETTPVNRIFGGYLRSQLKCASCGYCSSTFDPFMDLSVELTGGVRTVDVALRNFTSKEVLDGGNRWRCGGCQKLVRAEKRLTVFKPPNALVVQLKRFVFTGRASKIKAHVRFSDELNLAVSGPQRKALYDLTGVVVHAGSSMSSGHYFAYVRTSSGTWARMDDACVSKVKRQTVLDSEAYLLFYTRRFGVVEETASKMPLVLEPSAVARPAGKRAMAQLMPFSSPKKRKADLGAIGSRSEVKIPAEAGLARSPFGDGSNSDALATGAAVADSGGAPVRPRGLSGKPVSNHASGGSEASAAGTGGEGPIPSESGSRIKRKKEQKAAAAGDAGDACGSNMRSALGNNGTVADMKALKASSISPRATEEEGDEEDAGAASREVTGETVKIPYLPSRGSKRGLFKADVSSWADDEAGQEEGEGRGTGEEKDEDDMKGRLDKEALQRIATVKEEQAGILRKQVAEERMERASRTPSAWDRALDMGKAKKVKAKKIFSRSPSLANPFEARQKEIHSQRRKGYQGKPIQRRAD